MRYIYLVLALIFGILPVARAETVSSPLADIDFLVGNWVATSGFAADAGRHLRGRSHITREVGGAVLLRRDHTDMLDARGKIVQGFDQIMMIYVDGAAVQADYSDGEHVIHYRSVAVTPGRSVSFQTLAVEGAPQFRLFYELTAPGTLKIVFSMAPPGETVFREIAVGTAKKRA